MDIHEYENDIIDFLVQIMQQQNSMNDINKLLDKYEIEDSGFFDIEKWKAMGPDEIKQLEDYCDFITSRP